MYEVFGKKCLYFVWIIHYIFVELFMLCGKEYYDQNSKFRNVLDMRAGITVVFFQIKYLLYHLKDFGNQMNNLYNSLNGYLLIGTMFVKQKTKQFNLFFKFI